MLSIVSDQYEFVLQQNLALFNKFSFLPHPKFWCSKHGFGMNKQG